MNYKKMMPAAAVSLFALTCGAHAASNGNGSVDSPFVGPESSVAAKKEGGQSFSIAADLLYWNAHQDGLSYVLKDQPIGVAADQTLKGTYKSNGSEFGFGFRLGAHFLTKHDQFDVHLNWTNHEVKHKAKTVGNGTAAQPTVHVCAPKFLTFTATAEDTFASAWKVENNWIDLEIGRNYMPNGTTHLAVRPHFGLRHVNVCQTWDISATDNTGISVLQRHDSEYKGLGLRFGLDTQWALGKGISLFANIAWSYVYGDFDVKYKEASNDTHATPDASVIVRNNWSSGKAIVDTFFGFMYEQMANDDQLGFTVKAGWENHKLFGQNQFLSMIDTACKVQNHGDLFLRGCTLALKLTF